MQREVKLDCEGRWHNHLNPDVAKGPLTEDEEKIIFNAQKKYGNKWSEISKLLNGRTDSLIKNYFYSTLRRQLRELLRKFKGDRRIEPKEISIQYMRQVLKENKIPYEKIDHNNLKDLLIYLDNKEVCSNSYTKPETSPLSHSSLYIIY